MEDFGNREYYHLMTANKEPAFYYLFPQGGDVEILRLTDSRAAEMWEQGRPFLYVGLKTRAEAEALRQAHISSQIQVERQMELWPAMVQSSAMDLAARSPNSGSENCS